MYLNAHHPDIYKFLDTKRENADEKIRIKTLSLGVVVPDITFELARNNEDMYLFSPYDVQRVYGVPFTKISVTEKYREMVDNPEIKKTKISAREFFQTIAEIQFESGYPYLMFEDTVNEANMLDGRIFMSNLCVAPETLVLTDKGHQKIADIAGTKQNIWNGERFSEVEVVKTGTNQKLLHVVLSNGATIDATEYHKWYVVVNYRGKTVMKRTWELEPGDKLIKFELPVIEGGEDLPMAYTAGAFTGDGTYQSNGQPALRLHGDKHKLIPFLDLRTCAEEPTREGVLNTQLFEGILPKYTVPHEYSVKSRLDWLAGLLDTDGWGDGRVGLQIASIHENFLEEVRLMLMTLGVISRHNLVREASMQVFKEGQKAYPTKPVHRLVISGSETQKLVALGLDTHRLIVNVQELNRSATQFVTVVAVEDLGRVDDTYCFTEPKRGMGMFNGVLTGNCSEILQVQTDSELNPDLSYKDEGMDVSCNLGSMNVANAMAAGERFGDVVETAVRALTAVSDMTSIEEVPTVRKANESLHSIGLGQMNLHGFFLKEGIEYGSPESIAFTDAYFATVAYHAYFASNGLAMENGVKFEGFDSSKYADASYLTEKYADFRVDSQTEKLFKKYGVGIPSASDWALLSNWIEAHGLYNAYLMAVPPTGSISYINNATASIHPVTAAVEARKEAMVGRVFYPQPYVDNENFAQVKDAYELGYEAVIDVYAAATKHVDQGLSLTLFFKDTATTRDLNRAYIYAWRKGIKTIYYSRIRQDALEGTANEECVSCQL